MFRLVRNPDPRKKPPYGSRLDPYHPLSQGLVGCWLMNEGGGNKVFDANNMRHLDSFGSGISWIGDNLDFTGIGGVISSAYFTPITENSCTLVLISTPKDISSDQYASVFRHNTGDTISERNIRSIILGYQSGYWNIYHLGAYPTGTASDTQIQATIDVRQVVVYNSNGTTIKGFLDGSEVLSVSGNLDLHPDYPINKLFLCQSLAGNYANIFFESFHCYNRALTDSEILQLYEEPYGHILVPQYWYMVDFGAAGGTTYYESVSGDLGTLSGTIARKGLFKRQVGGTI